jgi:hypothetical protein
MVPLAVPFAILGRPGFLGFGFDVGIGSQLLQLLHDGYSDSGYWRYYLGNLETVSIHQDKPYPTFTPSRMMVSR